MKLDDDDFTLFGLPRRQALDAADLDARWKALQGEVHPDRFAGQGEAAQRLALQWAARINEAHRRLRDPLQRAALLCELHGVNLQREGGARLAPAFLMEQMTWREQLDAAADRAALEALEALVLARRRQAHAELAAALAGDGPAQPAGWEAAAGQIQALQFIDKFARDVDDRLARLDEARDQA